MNTTTLLLISLALWLCSCQYLLISHPEELANQFHNNQTKVYVSPIGLKPKTGIIHGILALAQPLSACSQLKAVDFEQDEDVFLMADDTGCLQSVKAHNLAASGTYIGLIKRNLNNTLHDKQIDIVHIPILQLQPQDYTIISTFISKNPSTTISLQIDFNTNVDHSKINMQFWLSPTQSQAYKYILDFKHFIKDQQDRISFYPRFALHSQTSRKQYIGCFSSGRFCPPELQYEGKTEGANIVGQALRQIIIADMDAHKWFDYGYYYWLRCLADKGEQLWQDEKTLLCSEQAMLSAGINQADVLREYNKSFMGKRAQVDGNTYLQQQRQLYIAEKITEFPILLLNGKQYPLQDAQQMKIRICFMMHPDPSQHSPQCQQLTNPPFFTTAELFFGAGVLLLLMVGIMFLCRMAIKRKMKQEMQGEVDKTLSQYYRYMESLEEPELGRDKGDEGRGRGEQEGTQIAGVEMAELRARK